MVMTDPIADMLTRIRNAFRARHVKVEMPVSKMKERILKILAEEGYISSYHIVSRKGVISVALKYRPDGSSVIEHLQRVSRPGRRVYADHASIPYVRGGMGMAVISTSQGVICSRTAKKKNIGGEVLCSVW